MTHCFGNLFSDPMLRITFEQAMWEINKSKTPGSMIYGNTIDFGFDYDRNFGALSSFVSGDAIGQRHCPSGHAVTAIPVTEAVRIPSADEIIQAHMTVDMMIEKSRYYEKYINWIQIEADKNLLVACGKIFFERVMNGLSDLGVDIEHPGEILGALKAIGPEQLEENFGVGQADKYAMRHRIPVRPADIVSTIQNKQNIISKKIKNIDESLSGCRVIVGSTDVHEFGKEIVKNILLKAGATVFDLGASVPVSEIVDTVIESGSNVVTLSTFNGIALSFAKELLEAFKEKNLQVHLIMGGLLNEVKDEQGLPEDVTEELTSLGVNCDNKVELLIDTIRSYETA